MNVWAKDLNGLSIGEHTKSVRGARHTLSHRIGEDDDDREYDVTNPLLFQPTLDVLWWGCLRERLASYKQRIADLRSLFGNMVQASTALTARSGCT